MLIKICCKCKEEKDTSSFHKDKHSKDGFCHRCKLCANSYSTKQRAQHGIVPRSQQPYDYKKWYKQYYLDHPDKCKQKTQRMHQWNKLHRPDKHIRTFQAAQRRARLYQATPKWASETAIKALYEQAALLTQSTGSTYHIDHIVPLCSKFVCGLHTEHNLRVLLKGENLKKKNLCWPDMPT